MTYSIQYNATKKLVTLSIDGLIKLSQSLQIIGEMVKVGRENNCRLFVLDGAEIIIQDNFIEVYSLFDNLEQYLTKRTDKLAIVFKRQLNIFALIENVAMNHGFTIRSFKDGDKAQRWLNIV